MTAAVFVDTNVFLYAVDEADPLKHKAAREWRAALWRSRRGRVSHQVLAEFFVQAARKSPGRIDETRAEIRDLWAWNPVVIDASVMEAAWRVQDRYGLSFWDALIVAAASAADCRYLLTEHLSHGQDLDGLRVVSPFMIGPEDLEGAMPSRG